MIFVPKTLIIAILSVLALVSNLLFVLREVEPDITFGGGGLFALLNQASNPQKSSGEVMATSTLAYLTPGTGTTTLLMGTRDTDQIDVNIFMVASSTVTDLRWRVEFSHSTSSVASEQLWFPEPANLTSNATTTILTRNAKEYSWVFASSTPHRIATSTAMNGTFDENTTGAMTFHLENIAARWTRVIFYLPTTASTSASTALGATPWFQANAAIQVFGTQKEPIN